MSNNIPAMTDPLGRHWQQPGADSILIDDTHAIMDRQTFDSLADYSRSVPSGVYPGKMWKAIMEDGQKFLRWYGIADDFRLCTCNEREILIAEACIDKGMEALKPVIIPKRIVRNWATSVMRHCDYCSHYEDTVLNDDGSAICATCCDAEHSGNLQCTLEDAIQRNAELMAALEQAQQRNEELEANQQKIVSMSAYSDERLKEIERHRENTLLGHLPADLARELRQTRSRLGNYYSLMRRADFAERKVANLSVALRANGIPVEGSE